VSVFPRAGAFRHQRALDGLRGLAVLSVLLFHFVGFENARTASARVLVQIAATGWVGVDLFFALSGFLITGILLDTKGSPHFFRNFYARRALRIFPLYYAVVLAALLMVWQARGGSGPALEAVWHRQAWLWFYAANIEDALQGRWVFNTGRLWLDHFWSLAVEEQFYLVWPLVVFVLDRRRVALAAAVAIVAAPLVRIALAAHGTPPIIVYSLTVCRVDALAVGGLVAVLVRAPALAQRALRWLPGLFGIAGGMLVALIVRRHGLFWLDHPTQLVAYTSLALLGGSTLLFVSLRPGHALTRALEWRGLVFFGKYSYGLYIFHYMLWPFLAKALPVARVSSALGSETLALLVRALVFTAVSLLLAVASYHGFERRFLALKRHFENGR
jgi:peptidoglycan/LPS O-acetylase OafA/YrhL